MKYSGTKEKVIHEKKTELENLMTDSVQHSASANTAKIENANTRPGHLNK